MNTNKLYRSKSNRMIAGVCAGLADYLGMDPTVVRLLTVVLAILSASAAFWAYIIMWIVIPEGQ